MLEGDYVLLDANFYRGKKIHIEVMGQSSYCWLDEFKKVPGVKKAVEQHDDQGIVCLYTFLLLIPFPLHLMCDSSLCP